MKIFAFRKYPYDPDQEDSINDKSLNMNRTEKYLYAK